MTRWQINRCYICGYAGSWGLLLIRTGKWAEHYRCISASACEYRVAKREREKRRAEEDQGL